MTAVPLNTARKQEMWQPGLRSFSPNSEHLKIRNTVISGGCMPDYLAIPQATRAPPPPSAFG